LFITVLKIQYETYETMENNKKISGTYILPLLLGESGFWTAD